MKLPNRSTRYPKVFLGPDQSYADKLKRKILLKGAIPGDIKYVFNLHSLEHELKYYTSSYEKYQ